MGGGEGEVRRSSAQMTERFEDILTLKAVDLDDDAGMTMQAVCYKMLQRQKDELERADATEKDVASSEKAAATD